MKRLLFIGCFVFALMGAYNQNASAQVHLQIDTLINFPDTAFLGQSYPVAIRVKNIGNTPYQGPLQIDLIRDSVGAFLYFSSNTIIILPNDTLTLYTTNTGFFGFVFDSTVFRPGNNVVVVWPYAAQGSVIVDSLTTDVYVNYFTSVKNTLYDANINVFPNPFNDEITFSGISQKDIERVRIFTLLGVKVYDEKVFNKPIELKILSPGCFLIDAETRNGQHLYRKIVKE